MCLNSFWKEKVILKVFSTQWHNWGQREVTHWSWTSLLHQMQLLFLVHDLSLLSPTEAHVHQHLELQNKSWLMDPKRFLNLGSWGWLSVDFCLHLSFCVLPCSNWASSRIWAVVVLPQECFLKLSSPLLSFPELDGVVGPPPQVPLRDFSFWDGWCFNQYQSFNFPSFSQWKGKFGVPTAHGVPCVPPLHLACFHTSCDACTMHLIIAIYQAIMYVYLGLPCVLIMFQCVHCDILLEDRIHDFFKKYIFNCCC